MIDQNELDFWLDRMNDRTLLEALIAYPERAKRVFGPVPVMRTNVLELGMILGARRILATPVGELKADLPLPAEETLRAALNELPPLARKVADEYLAMEKAEESTRQLARRIIKDATGCDP